ncbi:MAG: ROK family protein [Actinomycetota bacterium]
MSESFIGVDIGGTKISVAVLSGGKLSKPKQWPTDTTSTTHLLDQIVAAIDEVRGPKVVGVGVGVPSVVDFATGTIRSSVNIPLQGIPLRRTLHERVNLPIVVDNDANAAAFAEAHDDAGRLVASDLVMFTIGTGVGGGLVLGGRSYRGATGAAAEFGHTMIGLDLSLTAAPPRGFPQHGSLESLAAGRELDRLAQSTAIAAPDSMLGRLASKGQTISGSDAVEAAQAGDQAAIRALRLLGERLGIGIANAINTFDPEVVAIGGGVSRAGDLLLLPARETAAGYILPGVGTRTEIRLARHGTDAGVLGAALTARSELDSRGR